jgi:cytochrome c oxidase subunit 4
MSSTDLQSQSHGAHDPAAEEHKHPSDRQYVVIAAILAIITAAEVATYALDWFDDASTTVLVATLFPMMILKFAIVCAYFMHLKYDNPLFKRVFLFGLVLAVIVFFIMLTTFNYWWDDYFKVLTGG